jgi:hypothetical protein
MLVALILFVISALGGAALFAMRLGGKPLPMALALIHGAVAAAGLVVLALQVIGGHAPGTLPLAALVLFVVAALGGFLVFSFHLRGKAIPIPLTGVHAAVAVAGVVCLVLVVAG